MIKRSKMIQSTEAEATINVVTFEPDNKDDIIGIIHIVHSMTELSDTVEIIIKILKIFI